MSGTGAVHRPEISHSGNRPEIGRAVSRDLFKRGPVIGNPLNNAKINRIEPSGIICYETLDTILDRLEKPLAGVAEYVKNR